MNLDLLEFTFRFNQDASHKATWFYAILTFVIFLVLFGWVWGKMWNREWTPGGQVGAFAGVAIFSVLAAYSVFNICGIAKMEEWFQQQRMTLARPAADSPTLNKRVLTLTWDKLISKGGQQDISPPAEGGNEIRLNTPEDAFILASIAAEEARSSLLTKPPFSWGLPLVTKSPEDIANGTVDAIKWDSSRFPTVITPSNEWSSTAVTLQANHALDTAYTELKPRVQDLKDDYIRIFFISLLILMIFIPLAALADIKINPSPRR
jgi:hypothetical protein